MVECPAKGVAIAKQTGVGMPRVRPFAALVTEQIDSAQTRRALHLRVLCCLGDFYLREDTTFYGLAGLVHAQSCPKAKIGGHAPFYPSAHPRGTAIGALRCGYQSLISASSVSFWSS